MEIVTWEDKYSTKIELIDAQHQQLFYLTNELHQACYTKKDELNAVFKEVMSRMVEYVRFHFEIEIQLLNAVNYPDRYNHKKMHDDLVHNILAAAKNFNEGKVFIPNNFVRTLRDWICSHIAVHDRAYSLYVSEQIRTGKLTEAALKQIGLSLIK